MRCAQEDYASRSGEDLSKMRECILNLIRVMQCLRKVICQVGKLTEEGPSMAYIFNYQSAQRVCDKDDWAVALHKFEMWVN